MTDRSDRSSPVPAGSDSTAADQASTENAAVPRPRFKRRPTIVGLGPMGKPPEPDPTASEGRAAKVPPPPELEPEPPAKAPSAEPSASVLMIGGGSAMQAALAEALMRRGLELDKAPANTAVSTAVAAAPDLILLVGDAAEEGGIDVLARLGESSLGRTMPVAILADGLTLSEQLQAYRQGASAVIRRSASVDEIAERVAALARGAPQSEAQPPSRMGESTVQDLMASMGEQMCRALELGSEPARVRIVLSNGRGVAQTVDDFVEQLKLHVIQAEPLEYEIDRRAGGKAGLLGAEGAAGARSLADIQGARLVIADADAARADAVAHELRSHGATVVVTNLEPAPERFARVRQLDPIALIIGSEHQDAELVRAVRSDSRARWAAQVTVQWDDVWPAAGGVEGMLGTIAAAAEPERNLKERVGPGGTAAFDVRLESLGPARLLRALVELPRVLRATIYNPRLRVQVDISDGLVAGAIGESYDDDGERALEGYPALAAMLSAASGRVEIENVERPACLNVMSPVEVALEVADAEASSVSGPRLPVTSSLPPAQARPSAPGPVRAAPAPAVPFIRDMTDETMGEGSGVRGALTRQVSLPLWVVPVSAVLVIAFLLLLFVFSGSESVSAERQSSPALSGAPGEPGAAGSTLVDRARAGNDQALAELEERAAADRTPEETFALAEGRAKRKAEKVARLESELGEAAKPGKEQIRELMALSRDPEVAPRAQAVVASLPGPISADLLYEIWIGTPERTLATELAEQLVYTEAVRSKASPALNVALSLRRVTECEEVASLLPELEEHGDRRALRPLVGLNKQLGCAPRSNDCLSCLPNRTRLVDATAAAGKRPAPEL